VCALVCPFLPLHKLIPFSHGLIYASVTYPPRVLLLLISNANDHQTFTHVNTNAHIRYIRILIYIHTSDVIQISRHLNGYRRYCFVLPGQLCSVYMSLCVYYTTWIDTHNYYYYYYYYYHATRGARRYDAYYIILLESCVYIGEW